MKSKYPVKNIRRISWAIAIASFSFVFTFLFLFGEASNFRKVIIYSALVFINLLAKGYMDIWILLFLEKRSYYSRKLRLALCFTCCAAIDSIAFFGFAFLFHSLNILFFLANVAVIIIVINAVIIILQDYVILAHFKTTADLENSQLKIANTEAAIKLLRQQIHPHFLFNALNTLKSLYKKNPKTAEEYLIRLSDFLRASISDDNIRIIRLKDEIKLCLDYLEMQKIRFGKALDFSITISDDKLNSGFVPSFSIQPLLENAIKHNEITEESPLHIVISQEGEWVKVRNNIQLKTSIENSAGSGLSNLAERYRILSNDELIIEDNGIFFSVSIKILDHESSDNRR